MQPIEQESPKKKSTIEVKVGVPFQIWQQTMKAAGYWPSEEFDKESLELVQAEEETEQPKEPDAAIAVGSFGRRKLTFVAKKSGSIQLELFNAKPWTNEEASQIERFEINAS